MPVLIVSVADDVIVSVADDVIVSVADDVIVSVAVGGIVDGIIDTVPVSCIPYDSDADGLRDMPNVSVAVGGVDTIVPVTVSDAVTVITVTVSDAVPVITVTVSVSDTDMVSVAVGGIVDGMCVVDGICVTEGGM